MNGDAQRPDVDRILKKHGNFLLAASKGASSKQYGRCRAKETKPQVLASCVLIMPLRQEQIKRKNAIEKCAACGKLSGF